MSLLSIRDLDVSFSGPKLLDGAQLTIEPGERLALIGRNGEGKSTLMKVISGQLAPDRAEWERSDQLKVAMMPQALPTAGESDTVFDVAVQGLGELAGQLHDYHEASMQLGQEAVETDALLARMSALQDALEASGGWVIEQRVEAVLSQLELNPEARFATLSGGQKRRVTLAQALVSGPTLLLLDEPTNHLDLPSVQWLERFLAKLECAVLFVTHDRAFLKNVATAILELDRGNLKRYDCGYDTYLRRREEEADTEAKHNAVFDKKLKQEEAWLRQGIKARRTRNEGRVRALMQLRRERAERRERSDGPTFAVEEGSLSGRKVVAAKNLSFSYGEEPVVKDLTLTLWRGDKVGIIGPNGSGKTTLIRLLLGELEAQGGTLKLGTNIQVAYFDQHRAVLDPEKSVRENVCGENENVIVAGRKRHIYGYLQDFLFPPDRARSPVKMLSGGERNRLLLARLFTQPANVLVLDEPTNDLDLETLELLETILVDFEGTLLLVSHDREFLDRVVTSTLALEGQGKVLETVGGFAEYERRKAVRGSPAATKPAPAKAEPAKKPDWRKDRPKVRSQKEERELAELPAKIEQLETRQGELAMMLADPEVVRDPARREAVTAESAQLDEELPLLYARWEELEALPPRG